MLLTGNRKMSERTEDMKKRMIALLILSAFILCALSGCKENSRVVNYEGQDGETTTITFFGNKYEPENVMVIEEIISGFMTENPGIRVSMKA